MMFFVSLFVLLALSCSAEQQSSTRTFTDHNRARRNMPAVFSPGATLSVTGQGIFSITVPEAATFAPDHYSCSLMAGDGRTALFTYNITTVDTHAVILTNQSGYVLAKVQLRDVTRAKPWIPQDLVHFDPSSLSLWFSVDKKNGILIFGYGYPVLENVISRMQFIIANNGSASTSVSPSGNINGSTNISSSSNGSITNVSSSSNAIGTSSMWSSAPVIQVDCSSPAGAYSPLCQIATINSLACTLAVNISTSKFPVVNAQPPVMVDPDQVTLDILDQNTATVPQNLPQEVEFLYSNIAGKSIVLQQSDAIAIDRCVKTPGCFLYEKLKAKADSFGKDPHMVYLRVTVGPDQGNSPGSPFVMEIWPPQCYSPIHDHANTAAVIKVLYGNITSRYFNPLADRNNGQPLQYKESNFQPGDVTYLTPSLFQTHQLINEGADTCITIQAYNYLASDEVHYETFDYVLPWDDSKHHFTPGSDYDYLDVIRMVRNAFPLRQASDSEGSPERTRNTYMSAISNPSSALSPSINSMPDANPGSSPVPISESDGIESDAASATDKHSLTGGAIAAIILGCLAACGVVFGIVLRKFRGKVAGREGYQILPLTSTKA